MVKELFQYEREASRVELIIRIFYNIALYIVMLVYGFVAGVCLFIQWFVILILGRRSETLSEPITGYYRYITRIYPYMNFIVDERPEILPNDNRVYIDE